MIFPVHSSPILNFSAKRNSTAKYAQTKCGKRQNNCANHCKEGQYCGLNAIQVGTHEAHPTMDQCTDCQSFKKQ